MTIQNHNQPLKDTKLFNSLRVGKNELGHRVVHAPTTRFRALEDHTPSDLQLQYYDDRTKIPGSLVVTEAMFISPEAGLYENVPGIWNEKQVEAWKKITDKVHENKSFISAQFWFLGRVGDAKVLKKRGYDLVAPSPIYESDESKKVAEEAGNPIRALTEDEIHDIIYRMYPEAAKNAIKAGFDYIEIHGAHGYLLDQFLQPVSNKRTDKYGGSIENRARIVLEIIDNLIKTVGADRLAIRISPWATFQGMKADGDDVHSITTFSYLVHELQKRANQGNELAYLSIVEPRASGILDVASADIKGDNTFVSQIWKGIILKSGNFTYDAPSYDTLIKDIEDNRTMVGFGRNYISNPDLVHRLAEGYELTPYNRETFYAKNNWQYNTYTNFGVENTYSKEKQVKVFPKEIS